MIAFKRKFHLQLFGQWLCSDECLFDFRCESLAWMVYTFGILLLVPDNYITGGVSKILMMFDLRNLESGCSEGASGRMQIHLIWHIWQFCGGVFFFVVPIFFFAPVWIIRHNGCFMFLWYPPQEFVCDAWVCEMFSPSVSVTRLLGRSKIGDAVGCVQAAASEDTQEITYLGGCLMWNYSAVCGCRVRLKIFWGSVLVCGNTLRGITQWCFLFLWCVVSIGMSRYWQGSNQAISIWRHLIMYSLGQRMPCSSNWVRWICPWMPICVNLVPVVG